MVASTFYETADARGARLQLSRETEGRIVLVAARDGCEVCVTLDLFQQANIRAALADHTRALIPVAADP